MWTVMALLFFAAGSPGQQSVPKTDIERPTDPQDKIICKKFLETGSLVRGKRICKTKADWERERAAIRSGGPGVDSCSARANGGQC